MSRSGRYLRSSLLLCKLTLELTKYFFNVVTGITIASARFMVRKKPYQLQKFLSLINESLQVLQGEMSKYSLENNDTFFIKKMERNQARAKSREAYAQGNLQMQEMYDIETKNIGDSVFTELGVDAPKLMFLGTHVTSSIGHMALILGLRARIASLYPDESIKYLIVNNGSANNYYLDMWTKYFPQFHCTTFESVILQESLWPYFDEINAVKFRGKTFDMISAHNETYLEYEKRLLPNLLTFSDDQHLQGKKWLNSIGIQESDWFVVLHVRDNALDSSGYGRNAQVSTYVPAIRSIIANGGHVIRIGNSDSAPLPRISGLHDLTRTDARKNWHDVYAMGNCKFMIGSTSGPQCVPATFGIPMLATNMTRIAKFPFFPKSLAIPKLVKFRGKLQTFEEMLETKSAWTEGWLSNDKGNSMDWQDNTPEEIELGVQDMMAEYYLKVTPAQLSLNKLIEKYGSNGQTNFSPSFLQKYSNLI